MSPPPQSPAVTRATHFQFGPDTANGWQEFNGQADEPAKYLRYFRNGRGFESVRVHIRLCNQLYRVRDLAPFFTPRLCPFPLPRRLPPFLFLCAGFGVSVDGFSSDLACTS